MEEFTGRPIHRGDDNIKINLTEIGYDWMDWVHLASGYKPVAASCIHSNKPSSYIKGGEFLDQLTDY
jgi:hypothetical protein